MSNLLTKASENYKVAMSLVSDGKNLTPSIHCSYYACLQTMIHILLERKRVTEVEINNNVNGQASHDTLIQRIVAELGNDHLAIKKFSSKIRDLKNFRKSSDYTTYLIDPETAINAQLISLDIKTIFRNKFSVIIP